MAQCRFGGDGRVAMSPGNTAVVNLSQFYRNSRACKINTMLLRMGLWTTPSLSDRRVFTATFHGHNGSKWLAESQETCIR